MLGWRRFMSRWASALAGTAWPESLRWAMEFLPEYFTDAPCGFHAELFEDLERIGWRRLARVAPRGHAKSTCAGLAFPLWCICERKRRNIVIITHELGLATGFVRDIRSELESNERIRAAYGDLGEEGVTGDVGEGTEEEHADANSRRHGTERDGTQQSPLKWTEGKFTTANGVTVHARGVGASFRGLRTGAARPDLIICDD